jgi:hypothetical protein
MKNVAFVCVLFLFFACKKDLTYKTEAFYIEKDSTTAYLGQKTVKVTVSDTLMNSTCSSSYVEFENLAQTGIKIFLLKNGVVVSSSILFRNGGTKTNAKFDLCGIFPCNTSICPTASDVIPLMKITYDTTFVNSRTEITKYIEPNSNSVFLGQETIRLTRIDTTTTSFTYTVGTSPRTYCLSNQLALENLTDKTVEVTIYNGLAPTLVVWKKTVIQPRQKAGEKFNLQQAFDCYYCCSHNSQVIPKIKVNYN